MEFRYGLDDRPPFVELTLFGLQWLAISLPTIVIIGKIVAGLHFGDAGGQVLYLQKLSFATAATLLCQVLWGHRLPLILGPATVLLIGVIASQGFSLNVVYSSILVGGAVMALVAVTGLFSHLQRLFTSRVVAVVLLLIAFILTPTILGMIVPPSAPRPLLRLCFALALSAGMFAGHRVLTGVWKSTLIIWSMALGTLVHFFLFPTAAAPGGATGAVVAGFFNHLTGHLDLDPGVLISFFFCFVALAVNDLGSIQSMYELLRPSDMGRRITRGMAVTGVANVLSGFLGVVGLVNYSLSPGVIASTGCASRFTLVPAGVVLLGLSFFPGAMGWIGAVPPVVIGSVLIYILSSQIAAGMMVAFQPEEAFDFTSGLVIGAPVLLGALIALLPSPVVSTFPAVLQPILGNGFVVGVAASLVLEHLVFRR